MAGYNDTPRILAPEGLWGQMGRENLVGSCFYWHFEEGTTSASEIARSATGGEDASKVHAGDRRSAREFCIIIETDARKTCV